MNKYQKKEVKFSKNMTSVMMENSPLSKFKIARKYTRGMLSYENCKGKRSLNKRYEVLMKWYLKVLKNWKW